MPKVLFAGGGIESVVTAGTAAEVTTAGRFDATYAHNALQLFNITATGIATGVAADGTPTNVVAGETFWGHGELYSDGMQSITDYFAACDSAGNPWARLQSGAGGYPQYGLFVNTGTVGSPVWTQKGANFTISNSVLHRLDIKVTIDAAGLAHSATLYLDDAQVATGTWANAGLTTLQKLKYCGANVGGSNAHWSQIMITEGMSTVGGKVDYNLATGAGNSSGLTGAYTDINETILNDTTVLTGGAAGLKSTFAYGDVTVPATYSIAAVFVATRAKNDGSGNIKSVVRSGGADYSSANLVGISAGYAPIVARYDANPAGGAWSAANFNAAEFGIETAA